MSNSHWIQCRHADAQGRKSICMLAPGVLVCPCRGQLVGQEVAKLVVDKDGQIVWMALDRTGSPVAHHTFVAVRKDDQGNKKFVQLLLSDGLTPTAANGVGFFTVTDRQGVQGTFTVEEIMANALAGVEQLTLR